MKINVKTAILLAVSMLATGAQAASINGAAAGIASPTTSLTFDEVVLPNSTALTNQYSAYGISFSGLFYNPCVNCVSLPAKPDIGNFTNEDTGSYGAGFTINFSSVVSAASFRFASNGGTFNFSAYNGATLVESFSGNGGVWGNYGFTGINFTSIAVSTPSAMLIDNLSVTAVPEPETYAMLLGGLGLVALLARRKARAAA